MYVKTPSPWTRGASWSCHWYGEVGCADPLSARRLPPDLLLPGIAAVRCGQNRVGHSQSINQPARRAYMWRRNPITDFSKTARSIAEVRHGHPHPAGRAADAYCHRNRNAPRLVHPHLTCMRFDKMVLLRREHEFLRLSALLQRTGSFLQDGRFGETSHASSPALLITRNTELPRGIPPF